MNCYRLLFLLCFMMLGCGRDDRLADRDIERIDVEFESPCSVVANGVHYDFDGPRTAFTIRRRFFHAKKIVFRGIEKVRLDDLLAFHDLEKPHGYDGPDIRFAGYAIVDGSGIEREFVFWPMPGLSLAQGRRRLVVVADSREANDLSFITKESISNTYLCVRCEFGLTTGARIIKVVDRYYSCTAERQKFFIEAMDDNWSLWEENRNFFEQMWQKRTSMMLYRR